MVRQFSEIVKVKKYGKSTLEFDKFVERTYELPEPAEQAVQTAGLVKFSKRL